MSIAFTIPCIPPKTTSQTKRAMSIPGHGIRFFKSKAMAGAEADLISLFRPHAPPAPLAGPVVLSVAIRWPWRKSERVGVVRAGIDIPHTSKPDLDNSVKLIADCLTRLAFWGDDSQVHELHIKKSWSASPGITIEITQ